MDGGLVKSMTLGRIPKVLLMSAETPSFPVEWDVFNRFEMSEVGLIGAESGCRVSLEFVESFWLSRAFRLEGIREWVVMLSSDRSPGDCIDLYSALKYMRESSQTSRGLS